jgi:hypothetical protein
MSGRGKGGSSSGGSSGGGGGANKPKPGSNAGPVVQPKPASSGNKALVGGGAGFAGLGAVGLLMSGALDTAKTVAQTAGAVAIADKLLDFLKDPLNLAIVAGVGIGALFILK